MRLLSCAQLYQHLLFVIFLIIAIPMDEVIAHCNFNLHFPDDYDIGHLFICLLAICMSYLSDELKL